MSPLPETVLKDQSDLQLVGQTRLKRFGIHIYDASFYIIGKKSNEPIRTNICALSITYARNISASRLLAHTKNEWERLGFAEKYPLDAWLRILKGMWPDVTKGDQLVVVTTPDGMTTFYNKNNSLGKIQDRDFGKAFLAIWLDENSRYKKNRKELLGE